MTSKLSGRRCRIGDRPSPVSISGITAALLAISVLAACSSQGGQQTSSSSTLRIFNDMGSPYNCNFNPLQFALNGDAIQWGYVYEPLVVTNQFEKAGEPSQYMWLASNYKWSSDNRTVTFTIRKGVKWSDGRPFTAADVIFTFDLIKKFPALDVAAAWQAMSSIRQEGQDKVVVGIKPGHIPGFNAIASNTYIAPKHIWEHIKNPVTYVDAHPIGTGPFTVAQCTPQLIKYVRNPNYWQPGRPYISQIIMPDYTSNNTANADLEGPLGDTGAGGDYIPNIQHAYIDKDPAHRVYWFPPVNNWSLTPNDQNPLLKNPLVRQAISYAINRQEVSQVAESGEVMPASQTGIIQPFSSWYNKAADAQYNDFKYSPATAIKLLKQAGFVRGPDGIFRTKAGTKLSLSIIIVGAYSDSVAAATIMSNNLRAVGIEAQAQALSGTVYGSRLAAGNFTLAWAQVQGGITPYYEYYSLLDSANSAPIGKPAISNYERWSSPETDRLLAAYGTTRNSQVQHSLIDQIQSIMVKQAPVIPILQGVVWNEWSNKDFVGWPTVADPYVNPCNYCTNNMGMGVVLTRLRPREG